MQPRYQIHLRHDGKQYVAIVPELDGCNGVGETYAEALAAAEKAMKAWVFCAINAGRLIPKPAADFVWRPPVRTTEGGAGAAVLQRLRNKYGNLTNRALAIKCGLTNVDSTSFSGAVSGLGARSVRIAIALDLDELPSKLWPNRSVTINDRDDAALYAARQGQAQSLCGDGFQHPMKFGSIGVSP